MLIIRKGIVNNPIATVSMNKTLSNPYYLFSFQHIASKERVSFVPEVITSNCRYDKFRFVEFQTNNLSTTPPMVNFPYLGQYYYSIYEQVTSGNTDPALAYNKLESGRAVVIVGNDDINECLFEPYISNDENFANVIYVSDDEGQCITNDCCISNIFTNTQQPLSTLTSHGLDGIPIVYLQSNFSGTSYNSTPFRHIIKLNGNGEVETNFNSNSLPLNGGITNQARMNALGEIGYNIYQTTPALTSFKGIYVTDNNGSLLRQYNLFKPTETITSFNPSLFELLDDGSVIFMGLISGYSSTVLSGVAKFDSVGNLDPISTGASITGLSTLSSGRNSILRKDRNGKILYVTDNQVLTPIIYNGVSVGPIFRINPDLSLDTTFANSVSGTSFISSSGIFPDISFADDGKIIVTWAYTSYSGFNSNKVIILNENGTIFTDYVSPITGSSKTVNGSVVDGDKIYLYGSFNNYSGSGNNCIVKIDFSGNVDTSFVSQSFTGINGMLKLDDVNFLMSGNFGAIASLGYGGYTDDVIKINQFGQPMMCEPLPSPTPTNTSTPTPTPTVTPSG
jgi:hypothetical protein